MTRNFIEEFYFEEKNSLRITNYELRIDVIAGTSFAKVLKNLAAEVMSKNKNLDIKVLPVENNFFGATVNVSGLLTGKDIIAALKKNNRVRDKILIPATALRTGENIFLDDVTLDEMQKNFSAKIFPIHSGGEFFQAINFVEI